jgi:filamentous hemagglutinin
VIQARHVTDNGERNLGTGPAYRPGPDSTSGSVDTRSGDRLSGTVDANGRPVRPGSNPVRVGGTIRFLYSTPVPLSPGDRNPSWIFAQVGVDSTDLTFFADPTTERYLIEQALLEKIGRSMLDPKYKSPKEQQEALYQATVEFLSEHPTLQLGQNLTAAQRKKITKPILWYKWQTVNGKKVLVPELILPEKGLGKYASSTGGTILAEDITITADKVTNTGNILATGNLVIKATEFLNERLVNDAGTDLRAGGLISAKTASIITKGDLTNRGGSILAGTSLYMQAGGDLRIEAQRISTGSSNAFGKFWSMTSDVKNVGAVVASGGDLVMKSKRDLSVIGSTVTAKGVATLYGKNSVTIESALDEHSASAGGSKKGFDQP